MSFERAAAFAPINIALSKYWGKRDPERNLPLAPSLSVTLAELGTLSVVAPSPKLDGNMMVINEKAADAKALVRVGRVMRAVRELAGTEERAGIRSVNTVPTAQGLASSASAFAALAKAASVAYGLELDDATLSKLARLGSGSATRSVHGGFVLWHRGEEADGSDSFAEQVASEEEWPLRAVIAHIGVGPKKVPSGDGMRLSAETSPFFDAWIDTCFRDVGECLAAIAARDLERLADVTEANCLAMHATMLATRPGLVYWQPATLAVIHAVRALRAAGHACFFTIDAGPSVVVLCEAGEVEAVSRTIGSIDGVVKLTRTRVGGGAHVVPNG
ncbi:MAG: hypothetical protein RIT45_2690 [Pseudomonadota bacterium]|jgi:diphosphomevalonate decarboxylase